MKKYLSLFLCMLLAAGLISCGTKEAQTSSEETTETVTSSETDTEEKEEDTSAEATVVGYNASQTLVITGYDWGPAVNKTVIHLDTAADPSSVVAEDFTVEEEKEGMYSAARADRTVTAAYTSDEQGNEVSEASEYITLEMAVDPDTGSPFRYDMVGWKNYWCEYYRLNIGMKEGSSLKSADGEILRVEADPETDIQASVFTDIPDSVTYGEYTGDDGYTLRYASYVPEEASEDNLRPLVIWLHGAGEGGTDPKIALLGNKVTALYSDEFQEIMGGALVLAPQTETFWMQYDEDGSWSDNSGEDSVFLEDLMALIEQYVSENPVDPDRIIIGGCSNGGFMTMDMMVHYSDYFAAAYPICECFPVSAIDDETLTRLAAKPFWFTYAENDTTVTPSMYEKPLIEKLTELNGNVRTSVFEDVHDTTGLYNDADGSAHQYLGHWSWIYFFNNECADAETTLWQWMSEQHK